MKKYIKPLSLVLLGALIMLIFSNTEFSFKHLDQHAVSLNAPLGISEDIYTKRTELTFTPTKEWVPASLFGDEAPKP